MHLAAALPAPLAGPRGRVSPPAAHAGAPEARMTLGLRRGEEAALAEIHREYGGAVLRYLRRALGDAGAAEDVHQEVFLEVWRRGRSYDPGRASLGTWIMLIARSRAVDHLRKRVPEPLDPHDPEAPGAAAEDPGAFPDALIERWRMAYLLGRLPEEEERVLRMRFHEGLSQSEIAARTGIPLGTIKTQMVRALGRMRDMVEAEEGRG